MLAQAHLSYFLQEADLWKKKKNNSFPVASSKLELSLQLKYSTAHQPNCWKVVTVFGWRYFAYYILFMHTSTHTYSHNPTRTGTHRKETQWIESSYASISFIVRALGHTFVCMFFSFLFFLIYLSMCFCSLSCLVDAFIAACTWHCCSCMQHVSLSIHHKWIWYESPDCLLKMI